MMPCFFLGAAAKIHQSKKQKHGTCRQLDQTHGNQITDQITGQYGDTADGKDTEYHAGNYGFYGVAVCQRHNHQLCFIGHLCQKNK